MKKENENTEKLKIEDVLNSDQFTDNIGKELDRINREKEVGRARSKLVPNMRLKRTVVDELQDAGEFDKMSIHKIYMDILQRRSDKSSRVREFVRGLCSKILVETFIQMSKKEAIEEGKE
jgi:hypothetical protein